MVCLIVASVLTFALSAYATGNAAVCSARNAAFDQGKRGCGFRGAGAGGTAGIVGNNGRTGVIGGNNGQTGVIGGNRLPR
ncbi:hypothetical protein BBAD15_g5277 [Beauveria bassiana D1-5]|uniref:Uncharacterized protein n=1 Tax=Beauveria bassiana D1-5 TaxID=1245745 RepID=A0A0A2VP41_BEABA|nr:hypothetical protein BBAD15_g5277 [Beauveria bassiana D1-5]